MRALITGANGMLGTSLIAKLIKEDLKIFPTDINTDSINVMNYLDIRNYDEIKKIFLKNKFDIVFHLAAETNVDKCENEMEHAFQTNAIGTENIAMLCQKLDTLMVYISTGNVFDGKKETPYTEYDEPNPINVYGKSKLEGEKAVKNLLKKYYIIRAGWMIGGGKKDIKFVGKIIQILKEKKELSVVNDKFGTPTFTEDISRCMVELINTNRFGLYHMTNNGMCSRYEIARKVVEILNLDDVAVTPVTSEHFPLPAPRPRSEALYNFKLELLKMNHMPTWEDALGCYIKTIIGDDEN